MNSINGVFFNYFNGLKLTVNRGEPSLEATPFLSSAPLSLDSWLGRAYNLGMSKGLTLCLLLVACLGLVLSLGADPSRLLWRDFITDEGWWTGEARDHTLFGDWVMDEYNQGLATPLATWTWGLSFRLLGPSLMAARLPASLASLLTLLLLALIVRSLCHSRSPGGAAETPAPALPALLLGSAIPFALHARVAMPEAIALLGAVAAWYWLAPGVTSAGMRPARALIAGLCFGAALSAKLAIIVAWPALAWIAHSQREESGDLPLISRWRPALHFTFAAILSWRLMRLVFELRFPREVASLDLLHRGENLPGTVIDALANIAYFPWPAPFMYQVAPLLALAGFGAWQLRLGLRGRSVGSQALGWLLFTSLAQCGLHYPADRRLLVFLPAIAMLAARGMAAVIKGEQPKGESPDQQETGIRSSWAIILGAALAVAFVLPGRIALWLSRLLSGLGHPMEDPTTRGLAALLFVATFTTALLLLLRRPAQGRGVLRAGLVIGWLVLCIEPFDLLIIAGIGDLFGRYDASRVWTESGGLWSLPWGILTLALVWIPLARSGLLPKFAPLERARPWLPFAVPLIALLWLVPTWLSPTNTLEQATASLTRPLANGEECRAVVGAEAPTLILGSPVQSVAIRDDYNRHWLRNATAGTRFIRLIEDSGYTRGEWPAGADSLAICPDANGRPRFLFAVWESE